MEQRAGVSAAKRELARIEVRQKKLLDMMLDDVVPPEKGKPEMKALEERRLELEAQLKTADEPPPLLHPIIADLYRSKVESLAEALQREDTRLEASEMLRGLIDSIVAHSTHRDQLFRRIVITPSTPS
jgi:site-specific DNA recombinase